MHRKITLFSLIIFALALSCSASGAREDSAPSAAANAGTAPIQYRENLAGVDFTGLDAAGKERALDLMNSQSCDCGCGMTIAECRVKDPNCGHSPKLAAAIIAGVKAGDSDKVILASLAGAAQQPAAAPADAPAGPVTPDKPVDISMDGARVKGNSKAPVTLVEFADYQCPYCVRAVPVVTQMLAKYPDDVKFVFKQFPLTSIHRFAHGAALASLAAGRQGKFWEMHDLLFANSRALDEASLKKYAGDLGLDVARFEKDMKDSEVAKDLEKDVQEAQRVGVSGTPSFFINGIKVPSWDNDTLTRMIEAGRSGGDVGAIAAEVRGRIEAQMAAQRKAQADKQAAMAKQVVDIDVSGAPVKGDPDAPVTIVEFADFQCPYCANAQPLIKQVLDAYPGKVKLAFKHLPLMSIHPNARPAAVVSVEAMEHGKFWEMHDLLFKNHAQLGAANLVNLARQVGLDPTEVETAIKTDAGAAVIDKDIADSRRVGVTGTPTYFINGKRVMQRDFDTFKRMIDEALAAGDKASASGY